MLVCWLALDLFSGYEYSSTQGAREGPTEQHFSILGLCWSAGPCLLSVTITVVQRARPADQQTSIFQFWPSAGLLALVSYLITTTVMHRSQTSRPADQQTNIFQFWASAALLVPVSCIIITIVVQRARPTDQHFSILGLCWSAGPCLLSYYYYSRLQ